MSPANGYTITAIVIATLTWFLNSHLKSMDNPSLKLYYFDGSGRAEQTRLILAYANIDFEDIRFSGDEWMAKYKQSMPWGQVPVLEVDGKKIAQSFAIARYAAKLAGLTGSNALEDLELDSIVDTFRDIGEKPELVALWKERDESKRKQLIEKFLTETLPYYLKKFEGRAKENNGYIALNKLTWVDLIFITYYESIVNSVKTDILEGYPNLQMVKKNVLSISTVQDYLKNRPADSFGGHYSLKQDI